MVVPESASEIYRKGSMRGGKMQGICSKDLNIYCWSKVGENIWI